MATTEIELDLPEYGYPRFQINDLEDAADMVRILRANGIATNLRGVS